MEDTVSFRSAFGFHSSILEGIEATRKIIKLIARKEIAQEFVRIFGPVNTKQFNRFLIKPNRRRKIAP